MATMTVLAELRPLVGAMRTPTVPTPAITQRVATPRRGDEDRSPRDRARSRTYLVATPRRGDEDVAEDIVEFAEARCDPS